MSDFFKMSSTEHSICVQFCYKMRKTAKKNYSLLKLVGNCGKTTVLPHVQANDGKINAISALVH
jgi:hypothetical protein